MRVLLDTNILIHREASKVYNKDIGLLFNWLDRLHYKKYVHPLSMEEINGHQDEDVVNTMRIKISNYRTLQTESSETFEIAQIRREDRSRNDEIDTSIIKELFNQRVDYLITEDRGIHRKSRILGISEKVFKIDAFLEKVIAENPELKDYKVLSVKKELFGRINLADSFFDSFRNDYEEFENWFNGKSEEVSYVCMTDEDVRAFLYLKLEDESESYTDITPSFSPKRRLKIGTFKVTSTGFKLGERFLKIIFDNALQYGVDEIYVTIFDKREEQDRLIQLLQDWGFMHHGIKTTRNGIEQVYIKSFVIHQDLSTPRNSFPFVSRRTNKHIVPIYPKYHTELFPDSILNNESPNDFIENEPHRNAIKKIYISRSINRDLKSGDLVLFYRTGGHYRGVISTIGVIESIITNIRDEQHFIELCRKRSVFNDDQLRDYWNWTPGNRPFIVNFLYLDFFPTPKVNLATLRGLGLIQSAPRGFEPLSNDTFNQILIQARANESYIVD